MNKQFHFRERRKGESRKAYQRVRDRTRYKANPVKFRARRRVYAKSLKGKASIAALEKTPRRKAQRLAANRRWYKANPEKAKRLNRKWYKEHPLRVNAAKQKWRKENPEKKNTSNRKWGMKGRKKISARHSAMLCRSKTLRKRGIAGRVLSLEQHRKKLFRADGSTKPCHYCRHKMNETSSGLDRKDNAVNYTNTNTVAACMGCNSWKNSYRSYAETMAHFKPMREAAQYGKR